MPSKSNVTPKPTDAKIKIFAEAIHRGESQISAYHEMHPSSKKWLDTTVYSKASSWAKVGKVVDKVAELQKGAQTGTKRRSTLLIKCTKRRL